MTPKRPSHRHEPRRVSDDIPLLAPPRMQEALVTCGALLHFVAADRELTERFAAAMGVCQEHDNYLTVLGYLSEVHDIVAPHCDDYFGPRG